MVADEVCSCNALHQERLDRVQSSFPTVAELGGAAETFRLLGEPGRLRIVLALSAEELCVCDLAAFLEASSSAVSHQLRLLKQARVVKSRREGKVVYYRLDDGHIAGLVTAALDHSRERNR